MSIAPANNASIAAGPALKLVHWTLTCGPMALSKKPLALPTMACACVILGKAPTRIVLALPCPEAAAAVARNNVAMIRRLITLLAPNYHGQNAAGVLFLVLEALAGLVGSWSVIGDQVGQRSVIENAGSGVAHVQKNLIQRAVR